MCTSTPTCMLDKLTICLRMHALMSRWDMKMMDQLPEYMKLCFLALYNSINEMAYDLLKDQGSHFITYFSKAVTCWIVTVPVSLS